MHECMYAYIYISIHKCIYIFISHIAIPLPAPRLLAPLHHAADHLTGGGGFASGDPWTNWNQQLSRGSRGLATATKWNDMM